MFQFQKEKEPISSIQLNPNCIHNFIFSASHNYFATVYSPWKNKKSHPPKRKTELFRWTLSLCPWTLSRGQKKNDAAYAAYAYVSSPHYVYARWHHPPGTQGYADGRGEADTFIWQTVFNAFNAPKCCFIFIICTSCHTFKCQSSPLAGCLLVCVQLLSYNHNFIKHIFTKAFSTLNCIVITAKALACEARGLDIAGVLHKGREGPMCTTTTKDERTRRTSRILLLRQRQGAQGYRYPTCWSASWVASPALVALSYPILEN